MINHIPDTIELIDFVDDGEQARHYHFRLLPLREGQIKSKHLEHNWQNVQPGQFFMLYVPSVGEAPFTFTKAPNKQGEFRAFVRKMGQVTSGLFAMQRGDILGARGPFGRGWPIETIQNNNILIVAGGCGLAPLVTFIDGLIDKQVNGHQHNKLKKQQLVLVYGARNETAQMLNPERDRWQQHIKIFNTLDEYEEENISNTFQGSPLTIISEALSEFTSKPRTALLCGPEIMMKSVANYLTEYGIAGNDIFLALERRMHCAVGLCGHCYINNKYVCTGGPTFSWQEVKSLLN
jgi:anaerobic sulfite reductase subunit B|tara:strand:- start:107 stop:982 length:876 start_codon:yes stop_codon:yes gene_type:complete